MPLRVSLILLAAFSAALPAQRTALAPGSYAIRNISLVPMTRDTVIPDAVVLVRDGRIAAAGSATRTRIPAGMRVVDGEGGFLLPGLADMHTHLFADDRAPDSLGRYEVGVMLANGITAARLLIGTPSQRRLRQEIQAGRIVGPQLWSATPHLAGRPDVNAIAVTTAAEARAAVDSLAPLGYDFLKITNDISRPVYDAIMAQAKVRGMRVDGHVNPGVGVAHAAASGQHMQHLDGWFEAALADSTPMRNSVTQGGVFSLAAWASLDHLDRRKVAPLVSAVKRSGVWHTPTLALFNTAFAAGESDEEIRARPDWRMIPKSYRDFALRARTSYWRPAAEAARTQPRREAYVGFRNFVVKTMSDSGLKLLAGSDTPDWFMTQGYTLHRELAAFVAAGLTPYQALVTATRNPAEFLNASKEWGTIEIGKRADLVLLERNPLEDIRHTANVRAVAIGGQWLAREELDAMVEAAAARINPGS